MPAPPQGDPFDVLSLPARFNLDRAELERAYLMKTVGAHPDADGSDGEAAQINEARRILADPELRAGALLARLDGPAKDENRDLPPGFLMDIMEVREEMESLTQSGDAVGLDQFRALAENRRSAHIEQVGAFFEQLASPPTIESLAQIRIELNAWRYAERMIEQIQPNTLAR